MSVLNYFHDFFNFFFALYIPCTNAVCKWKYFQYVSLILLTGKEAKGYNISLSLKFLFVLTLIFWLTFTIGWIECSWGQTIEIIAETM